MRVGINLGDNDLHDRTAGQEGGRGGAQERPNGRAVAQAAGALTLLSARYVWATSSYTGARDLQWPHHCSGENNVPKPKSSGPR